MNKHAFIKHISYHLHTGVLYTTDLSCSISAADIISFCAIPDFHPDLDLAAHIMSVYYSQSNDHPILYQDSNGLVYGAVPDDQTIYLIGPVRIIPTPEFVHIIGNEYAMNFNSTNISCVDINDLIDDLILIYDLFHEPMLEREDVLRQNCISRQVAIDIQTDLSNIIFENQEYGRKHNPYDQERREFSSIRNGNVEQLRQSWAEDYIGTVGTLAHDPVRHAKNNGIVLVTLACRAAMEGGMLPELAYSLSDSYICRIEDTADPHTALMLGREAELQYTQAVHDLMHQKKDLAQTEQNPLIDICKDYIFSHLHQKILVAEIAAAMHVNPDYLSHTFKKNEGISLSSFILNEKINLVKNLLIYSKYTYIEIANYLGFASQSHLGRQFKACVGVTLGEYRKTYGVKDFIL